VRCGTVSKRVLDVTGTWDASYNLTVVEFLQSRGWDGSVENIRRAVTALQEADAARYALATSLREEAERLLVRARELEAQAVHTKQQLIHMKG
jgi:SOS-response transcriptional repressor LexA